MFNTFNGWKKRGRAVMSGERGGYENEYGDKMFHSSQTTPIGGVEKITVYRDRSGKLIKRTVQFN